MKKIRFNYEVEIDEDDVMEEYDLLNADEITDDMILEVASNKFDEEVSEGEVNAIACEAKIIN